MRLKIRDITLLLVCALFWSPVSKAQTIDSTKLDSLILILTLQNKDAQTVDTYLALADEYLAVSDFPISLTYANLARDLSKEIDYKVGEMDAAFSIAHIYVSYYLEFKKGIRYYDEALRLAEELNSQEGIIRAYRGYSFVYSSVHNYQLAIEWNNKAIDLARKQNNDQLVSDLSAYSGSMYEDIGDTLKALEMYQQVEEIEEENNYMNTSNAALTSIAHYNFLIGDINKSLRLYRSAITRFERLNDFRWESYARAEISRVYIAAGNLDLAEKHAQEGLRLAQEFNLKKERKDNYYVLALLYRTLGDEPSARKYQEAYANLQDSVLVNIEERKLPGEQSEVTTSSSSTSYYIWRNLLIIVLLIAIIVFFSGFQLKRRE
ncbi:MAG: hypothetical protein HUJ25_12775 [Crocinitomicaceae bacterium]|nr:hypothetical protein [Crocinitomicaceae bacterium]